MRKIKYFLGLDGGGTNSKAYLADQNATILASAIGPSANYQVIGIKSFANSLTKTIELLLSKANLKKEKKIINKAYIGLAGLDTKNDYKKIIPVLEQNIYLDCFKLVNDSKLALIGAQAAEVGIILISGTGSIALGVDRNLYQKRVGGWGHLFDDQGSGYDIALNALSSIFKAYDGRSQNTILKKLFLEELNLENEADLLDKIYVDQMDRAQIARLTKLVFRAAQAEDKIAQTIIIKAADSLAELIKAIMLDPNFAGESLIKTKNNKKSLKIAIVGGVFKSKNDLFLKNLKVKIKAKIKAKIKIEYPLTEIELKKGKLSPAAGAIFKLLKNSQNLKNNYLIKSLKRQDNLAN